MDIFSRYEVGEPVIWTESYVNGTGMTSGIGVIEEVIGLGLYKIRCGGPGGVYTRFIHDGWRSPVLFAYEDGRESYIEQSLSHISMTVKRDRALLISSWYLWSKWGERMLVVTDGDRKKLFADVQRNIRYDSYHWMRTDCLPNCISSEKDGVKKILHIVPVDRGACCGLGDVNLLVFDCPSEYGEERFLDICASLYPTMTKDGRIVIMDSRDGIEKMKTQYSRWVEEQKIEFVEI